MRNSPAECLDEIRTALAGILGAGAGTISATVPMRELGADSAALVRLGAELSERLGRAVPAWAVWQYPSAAALAGFLAGAPEHRGAPARAVAADEPVAIVGMGCRLPGGIDSPAGLWSALLAGTDAVGPVPADRWDAAGWYDEDPAVPGRTTVRRGGFLDDVAGFDAAFFRISPAEAEQMDPQQRIALEVAWSALEDAGLVPGALAGSRTGVFLGAMWQEYHLATGADPTAIGAQSATGWDTSVIAARIAYFLGLQGPALSIGSACSSSPAAIHLAAHSLRRGESDLALAGGISLMLSPHTTVAMTKFGGLNPDGQCRAFDAGAAGYVRGEGCGVVVLRRLSDALRDGDRVYAVLRGSAVNNDGASNGLTAPNPRAQVDVLRAAWHDAGVAADQVSYVEAHGTGTPLGDPIEAAALGEVFGPGRTTPLLIGSAKTNFGHLEPAAGVLGVLKAALALHHGELPASLHFDRPNPMIDFAGQRLEVVTGRRPWPAGERYAGVSGFGFGGTNVHLALAGAPYRPRRLTARTDERSGVRSFGVGADLRYADSPAGTPPPLAFCFSGHGGQWAGMGRDLLPEPAFRAALGEVDEALRAVLGWSVLDEIAGGGTSLHRTDVIQPALFAVQVALARTLADWGVRPDVVFGQSVGEVAAAVVAGALDLAQGARLIGLWSRLIAERASGTGAVIVCEQADGLTVEGLTVAGELAPGQLCLAGPVHAIVAAERDLATRGVRTHRVAIDYPSHSALLDGLAPELITLLGDLSPAPGHTTFVSAVTGGPLPGAELGAAYWARNMCAPMRLADAVRALPEGVRVVEVGPHPILRASLARMTAHVGVTCRRDRPGRETLEDLAGELWLGGVPVDWAAVAGEATATGEPVAWVLSGRTGAALRAQAAALREHLETGPEAPAAGVGRTLATARSAFDHRAVLIGAAPGELHSGLAALAAGTDALGLVTGTAVAGLTRPVLVFPGQGSQWTAMATGLLRESPVFAARFAECAAALTEFTDFSAERALADEAALARVDVVQPVLWAVMVSLAELWRSYGVHPAAVVGHSQGEIAAATVAGALSLRDGARVVALRSQAIARRLAGRGGMASLALSREETLARIGDRLSLAVVNGPGATVVSGSPADLDELVESCRTVGIRARRVPVDYASHCADVDEIGEELLELLAPVRPRAAGVPMVSTVTGEPIDTTTLDAAYWLRNLRRPVEFQAAVAQLAGTGQRAFVEVSPHPVLTMGIQATVADAVVVGTLRRGAGGLRRFLESAAEAYTRGVPVDWTAGLPAGRPVDLPTYRFQHRPYWLGAGRPPAAEVAGAGSPRERTAALPDPEVAGADSLRGRLAAMPAGGRSEALLQVVFRHIAAVLGYDRRDRPGRDVSFRDLGFDSVSGVALTNRLNAETGLALPVTLVFEQPTPAALAKHLLAELELTPDHPEYGSATGPAVELDALEAVLRGVDPSGLPAADLDRLRGAVRRLGRVLEAAVPAPPAEIDELSDDELFRMLDRKLGADEVGAAHDVR